MVSGSPPTPVRTQWKENPSGLAEGGGEVRDSGIGADDKIHGCQRAGGLDEIRKSRAGMRYSGWECLAGSQVFLQAKPLEAVAKKWLEKL